MLVLLFHIYFVTSPQGKRCRTTQEKDERDKEQHPLLPPCQNCRRQCSNTFTDKQREDIHRDFWTLDFNRRRDFLVHNVVVEGKKVCTRRNESRRQISLVWSLGGKVVCKTFFLHTIGYKGDKVVKSALKNANRDGGVVVGANSDGRAQRTPSEV